jgi:hypothetical protein
MIPVVLQAAVSSSEAGRPAIGVAVKLLYVAIMSKLRVEHVIACFL